MEHWNEAKIKDFAEVKGGKRLPKGKQLIKEPNSHPYIRIRDLGKTKYLQLNSEYEYVDDETHQSIISVKSLCFSSIVISTDALAYIILEHEEKNTMTFLSD